MKRIDALRTIIESTANEPVVATCAATSRELASIDDRDNHLYLLDAMGLAISVGNGIAQCIQANSEARCFVIEGDGSMLMNPGAALTAGYLRQENLVIIVLDNGVYASTAGIPTQARDLDLGAIAEAAGLRVLRPEGEAELAAALTASRNEAGPWFLHARIEPGNAASTPLLLMDPVILGQRFQSWLLCRTAS
ncbi:thiamine pyrophosphate-dependent enzyme [Brevibacterium sp. UCMA 11754]|uniref:thiamine pyrophosphate-dependent enzyme n=1 Tax=Brevibacterium sp. UCMA 11754 TaxID=2749198 RepID=UPI001F42B61A|nr:thiamine pyrophosphate-dependent enzyme [Brevibacterium sp. UCMA 11754]MCF2573701.1 phosphonopyruvate decarboxylase [Brevibacterium sp. UCMA 11754]MCF2573708.1 phosphonopyruvate decarboxylase [Brevibacterium sp. UCMA 11754]